MQTQFLPNEGGRIAFDLTGSGPLVVCVPSMGDLRQEYRFLAPKLVAAGYRVACMDVRGHGESTTGWQDVSVAGIGSDLVALLRALDNGPAVVVGTSMAAGAAVWAAAEAPECFRGLALIGPFVRGGGDPGFNLLASLLFSRPWGPSVWLRYYAGLYLSRKPNDFPAYCAALRANLGETGRVEALQGMLRASKRAAEQRLSQVRMPVQVVMGSRDPDFKDPAAEAAWVGQALHAQVSLLSGAGHYPHAEFPDETANVLLPFLRTCESGHDA